MKNLSFRQYPMLMTILILAVFLLSSVIAHTMYTKVLPNHFETVVEVEPDSSVHYYYIDTLKKRELGIGYNNQYAILMNSNLVVALFENSLYKLGTGHISSIEVRALQTKEVWSKLTFNTDTQEFSHRRWYGSYSVELGSLKNGKFRGELWDAEVYTLGL